MKITVLIENTTQSELVCEHGLSIYIEHNGRNYLLDAGTSGSFAENADLLGIDLSAVDIAVLSHGHYDHAGGLAEFFRRSDGKVYVRTEAFGRYWSANGGMHEIGIPENVLAQTERFACVSENIEIAEGVHLVGHITSGLEHIGERSGLYMERNGQPVPDDFAHEQSLVFDTAEGLVIFNSCSHGGAANIIREAREYLGGKPVRAYIGGLHMKGKNSAGEEICAFTDSELDDLCETIRRENIRIYTGHCTGCVGLEKLRDRLGSRVTALTTGLTFEL